MERMMPDSPQAMLAEVAIPKARQIDVIDNIMREFATFLADYNVQTVWFPKRPMKEKRRSPTKT